LDNNNVLNLKLKLILNDSLNKEQIFIGPRIGLSDKYPEYKNKLYRFLIYKNLIKKQKTKLILSQYT